MVFPSFSDLGMMRRITTGPPRISFLPVSCLGSAFASSTAGRWAPLVIRMVASSSTRSMVG